MENPPFWYIVFTRESWGCSWAMLVLGRVYQTVFGTNGLHSLPSTHIWLHLIERLGAALSETKTSIGLKPRIRKHYHPLPTHPHSHPPLFVRKEKAPEKKDTQTSWCKQESTCSSLDMSTLAFLLLADALVVKQNFEPNNPNALDGHIQFPHKCHKWWLNSGTLWCMHVLYIYILYVYIYIYSVPQR